MKPRDYQLATVDAIFGYWEKGRPLDPERTWGHPVAALPTGTGKSIIIAEFCRQVFELAPGTRILMLTHVKELVSQNFEKLLEIWPTAPAGIFSAGLRRKDIGRDITFAGIGSILRSVDYFSPDLILIDECHTVSPKETTTYRKVIASCMERRPNLKVVGLSATPYRLGQGDIVEPGGIFTDMCFDATTKEAFNWFFACGYLKPLIPKATATQYDISGVHVANTGDYNQKELQAAVDKDSLTRAAVAEMLVEGAERNHWLVFAAGIEHAQHVAAILVENGISAVCVHSKSTSQERDEATCAFKAGEVRALVNNGIFTTGFDFPGIDYIAVLRHTTSPGLWVQMLGRGTRPDWKAAKGHDLSTKEGRLACIASGRPNCLVSDFAGNTLRLGPINDPVRPKSKKKSTVPGDVPAKICGNCMVYNFTSARVCSECGHEFVFKVKITSQSSSQELIAPNDEKPIEPQEMYFDVDSITYSKHTPWNSRRKAAGGFSQSSLRVTYNCKGLRSFSEYICMEHSGHALATARQWWTDSTSEVMPSTVAGALAVAETLRKPTRIRVWINRANPQIQFREFP